MEPSQLNLNTTHEYPLYPSNDTDKMETSTNDVSQRIFQNSSEGLGDFKQLPSELRLYVVELISEEFSKISMVSREFFNIVTTLKEKQEKQIVTVLKKIVERSNKKVSGKENISVSCNDLILTKTEKNIFRVFFSNLSPKLKSLFSHHVPSLDGFVVLLNKLLDDEISISQFDYIIGSFYTVLRAKENVNFNLNLRKENFKVEEFEKQGIKDPDFYIDWILDEYQRGNKLCSGRSKGIDKKEIKKIVGERLNKDYFTVLRTLYSFKFTFSIRESRDFIIESHINSDSSSIKFLLENLVPIDDLNSNPHYLKFFPDLIQQLLKNDNLNDLMDVDEKSQDEKTIKSPKDEIEKYLCDVLMKYSSICKNSGEAALLIDFCLDHDFESLMDNILISWKSNNVNLQKVIQSRLIANHNNSNRLEKILNKFIPKAQNNKIIFFDEDSLLNILKLADSSGLKNLLNISKNSEYKINFDGQIGLKLERYLSEVNTKNAKDRNIEKVIINLLNLVKDYPSFFKTYLEKSEVININYYVKKIKESGLFSDLFMRFGLESIEKSKEIPSGKYVEFYLTNKENLAEALKNPKLISHLIDSWTIDNNHFLNDLNNHKSLIWNNPHFNDFVKAACENYHRNSVDRNVLHTLGKVFDLSHILNNIYFVFGNEQKTLVEWAQKSTITTSKGTVQPDRYGLLQAMVKLGGIPDLEGPNLTENKVKELKLLMKKAKEAGLHSEEPQSKKPKIENPKDEMSDSE
ncbi:MAG: hypothetical protein Tsb0021_15360 [Chlamydiales bacterium]